MKTRTAALSLRPVSVAFVVFGVFWGSWAVAAADVERELGLGHGGFGLLLSVALAGAAVSNAIGGSLAERWGTGAVLSGALTGWGALLAIAALVHHRFAFAAALVGVVAAAGLVDVVMNVAATAALSATPGALVRFHGRFNAGAALGAACMGLLVASAMSWRWMWVGVAAAAWLTAAACARGDLPAGGTGERIPITAAVGMLRGGGLAVLAAAFAAGAVVEGGVELWGVLFLRTHLPSGLAVGASSAVVAYLIAFTARVVLGPSAGRRGATTGVAAGAGAAAIGIVLLGTASTPWLAGLGLVAAAGGISMSWPLLLAEASAGRERPGAVVGAMTSIGYLGFVAGPALVGAVSGAWGLRTGLYMLTGFAVFVAVVPALARRQRGTGDASTGTDAHP